MPAATCPRLVQIPMATDTTVTGFQLPGGPLEQPPNISIVTTRKVCQLVGDTDHETGAPTLTRTQSRAGLSGTDLGITFEHRGKLWFLFGDSEPKPDPRHDDAIAWSTSANPEELDLTFVTDGEGRFKSPVIACPDTGESDCADLGALNVPISAVSDGDTMYVWFTTGDRGSHCWLARSDDEAQSFEKVYELSTSHLLWVNATVVEDGVPGLAEPGEPWVVIFGAGTKDHPDVSVAATPLAALREADRSALRYLAVADETGNGTALEWSPDESDCTTLYEIEVVDDELAVLQLMKTGTVHSMNEALVAFDETTGIWLATYHSGLRRIRARAARHWWGPWSDSFVLFDPETDYGDGPAMGSWINGGPEIDPIMWGGSYAAQILTRFTRRVDESTVRLYHLVSTWWPYTVVLMEATLHVADSPAQVLAGIEPR